MDWTSHERHNNVIVEFLLFDWVHTILFGAFTSLLVGPLVRGCLLEKKSYVESLSTCEGTSRPSLSMWKWRLQNDHVWKWHSFNKRSCCGQYHFFLRYLCTLWKVLQRPGDARTLWHYIHETKFEWNWEVCDCDFSLNVLEKLSFTAKASVHKNTKICLQSLIRISVGGKS